MCEEVGAHQGEDGREVSPSLLILDDRFAHPCVRMADLNNGRQVTRNHHLTKKVR